MTWPPANHPSLPRFTPDSRDSGGSGGYCLATPTEEGIVETETALAAIRRIYLDGFNSGDLAAIMRVHTADTVHLPSGMPPVVGQEAVRELMRLSLSRIPPGFRFEFQAMEARIADDFAVERGITPPASAFPGGKYIMLYEKEPDGCWRIAWTMTNLDSVPG